MKLLYCEILGFGKLKNVRIDLQDGLNVFLHENGWGKTTLCAFIKAMLYGIGDKRTKNVTENERIKYEPWSASGFGGALGIEYNSKQYRIERAFGKTPAQDVLRVYDERSKMLSYDFADVGERIGEKIFGVGKDGFERAVFFSDENATPASIEGDLKNGLSRAITNSQGEDIDGAIARLENAERALKAKRRPAQGLIDEVEERITQLREKRRLLDEKVLSAPSVQNQIVQLEGTVSVLNKKIERCASELSTCGENSNTAANEALKGQLAEQLTQAQTQLQPLTVFFKDADPKNIPFESLQSQTQECAQCKRAEEEMQAQASLYTEREAQKRALTERKTELERALGNYERSLQEAGEPIPTVTPVSTGKIAGLILFALSFGLFLIGALFMQSEAVVSAILFALGILFLCISVGIAKKSKDKGAGTCLTENSALQTAYLETQTHLEECEEQLRALLEETEENVLENYRKAKQKREELECSLRAYFSAFPFGEIYDFRLALQTLKEKAEVYQSLQCVVCEKSEALQTLSAQLQANEINAKAGASQSIKQTLFSLQQQKEELLGQKHALGNAYDTLALYKLEIEELNEEEKLLLEKHQRFTLRYENLQKAKELLLQAKNNLSDRYLTPVANACQKYFLAFGEKPFKICFDGQGTPLIKDSGFYRQIEFYSQGYRRLIDLCIRLAVIDSMYTNAPPLLIFDDPFAQLDDENFKVAKTFLQTLAKNRQILYFTCARARS